MMCTHSDPLPRRFYERDTVSVARELLGKVIVRHLRGSLLKGIIVEVEAYRGGDDPASHAYRGLTKRNQVMFGEPGHAYIYFTYGMHYCLNVTTEKLGQPAAVLIRAAQPLTGIDRMKKWRKTDRLENLTNGPAKLTQALSIKRALNGHDLTKKGKLYISRPTNPETFSVVITSRIGIKTGRNKPWRFFIQNSPFVSKQ